MEDGFLSSAKIAAELLCEVGQIKIRAWRSPRRHKWTFELWGNLGIKSGTDLARSDGPTVWQLVRVRSRSSEDSCQIHC